MTTSFPFSSMPTEWPVCGESVIARVVSTYRFRLVSHFLTAARRVTFVRTRGSLKLRLSKVQRALTLHYGSHGDSPFPICLTLAEKTGSRNYDF